MQNDREINDKRMQAVLQAIGSIMREHDLTGCVLLVNEQESAFLYQLSATWNAVVDDDTVPLGFRIRAKTAELGDARAQALLQGAAWTVGALLDFGVQTRQWMQDLFRIMRQAGLHITHKPFGGQKLRPLRGVNMDRRTFWSR